MPYVQPRVLETVKYPFMMMESTSATSAEISTVRLESPREVFIDCCVIIFDYISKSIKRQMKKKLER